MFLDGTVVDTIALETTNRPRAAGDAGGPAGGLTCVGKRLFAVLSALLILADALNDYFSRQRMLQVGLVPTGSHQSAAGWPRRWRSLSSARILQAAFGAILVPEQPVDHHRRL